MKSNPVAWFEIYVQDMNRAKEFYGSVLQVKLQPFNAPMPNVELWAFPGERNSYGAPGALVKMAGFTPGAGGTLVYFHCEDCAVEEARVAGSGGRVQRPKFAIGEYGYISLVIDPEGNMIGLHSMK